MHTAYLSDTTFQMRSYLILSSPPAHFRSAKSMISNWQYKMVSSPPLNDPISQDRLLGSQPRRVKLDLAFLHALGRLLRGTKGASRA